MEDTQIGLFGFPEAVGGIKKKRKANKYGWTISDHACRHCGGRVLVESVKNLARCAECGAHAVGDHTSICCCGAQLGALGRVLECVRNPAPSKESPYQIMVRERLAEKEADTKPSKTKPYQMKDE